MNWNTIEGRWKELKGNIKEQWGELTDDEIDQAEGKRDILLGKLQAKYGIAREEAEKQLDSWADKLNLD
ncbi:MAG: CsbD family protein [Alcanivorax sp.]|nr:CsbD family protein [Alcanivorax sp.]